MTKDLPGDRQTFRQADRETNRLTNRPAHRQTNKQAHRPTDRHQETKQLQIDRPSDRARDKQIY